MTVPNRYTPAAGPFGISLAPRPGNKSLFAVTDYSTIAEGRDQPTQFRLFDTGLTEVIAIIGYYTLIGNTLSVLRVAVHVGTTPPLPE
jgi:hypothetical protein